MVSLTPASFSPPAGCRDEGLTYSAKCFVKAFFSYGSADFLGVEILNFSAACGISTNFCSQLDPPRWRAMVWQGFFSSSPPFLSWRWVWGAAKVTWVPRAHLSQQSPLFYQFPCSDGHFLSPAMCHMLEKTEKLKRVSLKHQRNFFPTVRVAKWGILEGGNFAQRGFRLSILADIQTQLGIALSRLFQLTLL